MTLLDELVVDIITEKPVLSNSDNALYWEVLIKIGLIKDGVLTKENFMMAPTMEQIIRRRRLVVKKRETK